MAYRDLRTHLLQTLDDLLRAEGIGALSLRAVARKAGVSHAAPAVHFHNFAGMLTAYATAGFHHLHQRLEEVRPADHADGASEMAALGYAYIRFAWSHPGHFAVMFRRELLLPDDADLRQARDLAFGRLAAGASRCASEGAFPAAEIGTRAAAAWSVAHGLAALWAGGPLRERLPGAEPEALAVAVLSVFVDGVLRRPSAVGHTPPAG